MASPFPEFVRQGVLPGFSALKYNPSREWIFPSIIRAEGRLSGAKGRWGMYYSPHESPGGICLAWADDLAGPWREHPDNPLIANAWAPHYAVSHVASPHPLWIEEEKTLFLWYHGENDTTRLATSTDGVHFNYEGAVMTGSQLRTDGEPSSSCYYVRVFPHDGLGGGDRYVMLAPGWPMNIYVATSRDARTWRIRPEPLLRHPEGKCFCSPFLWREAGRDFVVYHCDINNGPGNILATEVTPDLSRALETYPLLPAIAGAPDFTRAGDPYLVENRGVLHLFYCAGERLKGVHALATARR